MSQHEIEEIEVTIDEARKLVEKGDMALKLAGNREFKKLVLDGYFVTEAARLAMLSSEPTLPENIRDVVMRDIHGLGGFKRYLSTLVQRADMARREIEDSEEVLEELREEGDDE